MSQPCPLPPRRRCREVADPCYHFAVGRDRPFQRNGASLPDQTFGRFEDFTEGAPLCHSNDETEAAVVEPRRAASQLVDPDIGVTCREPSDTSDVTKPRHVSCEPSGFHHKVTACSTNDVVHSASFSRGEAALGNDATAPSSIKDVATCSTNDACPSTSSAECTLPPRRVGGAASFNTTRPAEPEIFVTSFFFASGRGPIAVSAATYLRAEERARSWPP